ncbi:AraC family transcriptional regulator ligand-binding domain-containing protein [Burkholderia sp. Bp8963]|uniref:AraC family transcriptional regulator ligand-binding domain-containing protein n=1 Tax=Burkholderia sp. Bp8963 TaxID=2184547 RepID=UPI0021AB100E|nr:AraC family transcriptional regulator ligand-binding domain-containing protein [Burkholderia sp. Bp8963]
MPGLHVGQRIAPAHLGVLGYALHACRDAGAALARWHQYEHLIAYVAWLPGYSGHSALTRAFRRWTGESPQQWRSRQPARAANVARG